VIDVTELPKVNRDLFKLCYDEKYLAENPEAVKMCILVWHHDAELIRMSVQEELQAQSDYESRADDIIHPFARKVLLDIANEEKVHQYELLEILKEIDKFQKTAENRAKGEVEALRKE